MSNGAQQQVVADSARNIPLKEPPVFLPSGHVSPSPYIDPKLKLRVNEHAIQPDTAYTAVKNQDGSISITIKNDQNSVAMGYVRKSGAYSNPSDPSDTTVIKAPGLNLLSIFQSGTYKLDVGYNDYGFTTIKVKADASLQAIKIQLGTKVYFLELDRVQTSGAVEAQRQAALAAGAAGAAPSSGTSNGTSSGNASRPPGGSSESPSSQTVSDSSPESGATTPLTSSSPQALASIRSNGNVPGFQDDRGRLNLPLVAAIVGDRLARQGDAPPMVKQESSESKQLKSEAERLKKIRDEPSRTVAKAKEQYNELKNTTKRFNQALNSEMKVLEKELRRMQSRDPLYQGKLDTLKELKELKLSRLRLQEELAEDMSNSPDAKISKEGHKALKKVRQQIEQAESKVPFRESLVRRVNPFSGKTPQIPDGLNKPVDQLAANPKALRQLEKLETKLLKLEKSLDVQAASGKVIDQSKLKEVRDARRAVTIKTKELLEYKIENDTSLSPKKRFDLERKLYKDMKPSLGSTLNGDQKIAYESKAGRFELYESNPSLRRAYNQYQRTRLDLTENPKSPFIRKVTSELLDANGNVISTNVTDEHLAKNYRKAALDLAKTELQIAETKALLESNADAGTKSLAQKELRALTDTRKTQLSKVASEIDNELTRGSLPDEMKKQLESAKQQLGKERVTTIRAHSSEELDQARKAFRANRNSVYLKAEFELAKIDSRIASQQALLEQESDPTSKRATGIRSRIVKLELERGTHVQEVTKAIDNELRSSSGLDPQKQKQLFDRKKVLVDSRANHPLARSMEVRRVWHAARKALEANSTSAYLKAEMDLARQDFRISLREKSLQDPNLSDTQRAKVQGTINGLKLNRLKILQSTIDALDTEISTGGSTVNSKLAERKVALGKQKAQLEENAAGRQAAKNQAGAVSRLEGYRADLKTKQGQLGSAADESAKSQLTKDITELESKIADSELTRVKNAIAEAEARMKVFDDKIKTLNDKIKDPNTSESQKSLMKKELRGHEFERNRLTLEREYHLDEQQVRKLNADLKKAQNDLLKKEQSVRSASGPLKATLQADVTKLKADVDKLSAEVKTSGQTFDKKWVDKFNESVSKNHSAMERCRTLGKDGIRSFAARLSISEGIFAVMKADYSPEAKHTFLPDMIAFLNEDWTENTSYTTEEWGVYMSAMADGTRAAGNVMSIFALAWAGPKAGELASKVKYVNTAVSRMGSTRVATGVGAIVKNPYFGRALGVAGLGVNGYFTFSSGQLQHMNNLQMVGSTGEPIAVGVITGGALFQIAVPIPIVGFGIGCAIGGGVAVVGEAAGLYSGLRHIDAEMEKNWNKRSVRDSIDDAERGFVHSSPPERAHLTPDELEGINDIARLRGFSDLCTNWNPQDLRAMGFKLPNSGDLTAEERKQVANLSENWERFNYILDGRAWYNPKRWVGYGNPINDLPDLLNQTRNRISQHESLLRDLYVRSYRSSYKSVDHENTSVGVGWELIKNTYSRGYFGDTTVTVGGRIASRNEFNIKTEELIDKINESNMDKENVKELLILEFPKLNEIVRNTDSFERFVHAFRKDQRIENMVREILNDEFSMFVNPSRDNEGGSSLVQVFDFLERHGDTEHHEELLAESSVREAPLGVSDVSLFGNPE